MCVCVCVRACVRVCSSVHGTLDDDTHAAVRTSNGTTLYVEMPVIASSVVFLAVKNASAVSPGTTWFHQHIICTSAHTYVHTNTHAHRHTGIQAHTYTQTYRDRFLLRFELPWHCGSCISVESERVKKRRKEDKGQWSSTMHEA